MALMAYGRGAGLTFTYMQDNPGLWGKHNIHFGLRPLEPNRKSHVPDPGRAAPHYKVKRTTQPWRIQTLTPATFRTR